MSVKRSSRHVVVLAGPNGAGKTTIAPSLLRDSLGVEEFVNADTLAQGLSGFAPDRAAFAAGRIMLARLHELAEQGATFAFETTLASRSFAPWLTRLKAQRTTTWQIHDNSERPIKLIAEHAASGELAVAQPDIWNLIWTNYG